MYFILTILSFLTLSLALFGISTQIENIEAHNVFLVLATIPSIIAIITIFCMMFQNMSFRNMIKIHINRIRENVRNKKTYSKDLETYKSEFKQILTEMYPEYEKTIFKNMAQTDAQQLEIIMVKYPELKFDGVLINYTNGITSRLKKIEDVDSNINDNLKDIEDYLVSGWMLGTVTLPADTLKLINQ